MQKQTQHIQTDAELRQEQRQWLKRVTERIIGLPSLPTLITQLLSVIGDPASSARDVSKLISTDQALTAKILKVANSAFYGFPRKIATIEFAVVILGYETVKNLALSVAVLKRFNRGNDHPLFDRQQFWEHAIGCGVAGRMLARKRDRKLEGEAFVAGVLHDIGKLILIEYFPGEFGEALECAKDDLLTIAEAEEKIIGVTHAEVGGWLAEKWKLPETLVQAIAHHHAPNAAEKPSDLLIITHLANALTRHNQIGSGGDRLGASLSPDVATTFKQGRDISDEELLAELSETFLAEIETARVFTDLEEEMFDQSDNEEGGAAVGT